MVYNIDIRKSIILLLALLIGVTSCSSYKEVQINDITLSRIKLRSTSSAEIKVNMEISNPTSSKFTLTQMHSTVMHKGAKFADIDTKEMHTINKRCDTTIAIPLDIKILDPLQLLSIGINYQSWNWEDFSADIKMTVKSGSLKRTIRRNNVPLSELAKLIKNE